MAIKENVEKFLQTKGQAWEEQAMQSVGQMDRQVSKGKEKLIDLTSDIAKLATQLESVAAKLNQSVTGLAKVQTNAPTPSTPVMSNMSKP